MAHTMRAILLARATAASLRGLRLSKLSSHWEVAGRPCGPFARGRDPRVAVLDNGGRAQHQQLPQPFVAGPADAPQTLPARG